MKATNTRINEDIAALKSDLSRLGADISEMPNRLRSYRREKAMRSRERLRAAVTEFQSRAKDRVRDTSGMLMDHGQNAVDKWRGGIGNRPLASIAIAFVAGWFVAAVVGRRSRWP